MRWSWALPFCHCVCAKAVVLAAGRMRLSVRAAQQHSLLERRAAPRVGPGMPVLAPYVDSCNAMVWDAADATSPCGPLGDVLAEWGLAHRAETYGAPSWEALGSVLDVERRVLLSKPSGLWRCRAALLHLYEQGLASGDLVSLVLGHAVHAGMAYRPALSVIQHLYGFVAEHGWRVDALNDFERQELFYLAAVLPLLGADLGVAPSPVALCTDACESG